MNENQKKASVATVETVQSCGANGLAATIGLSPCLLRVQNLCKAFDGQNVLDGVNLELRRSEVVLLRGENGSGKTTLLNILTGNIAPDAGLLHYLADDSPRTYTFPRRWWQELNPWDHFRPEFVAKKGIGRTWQDVRLFGSLSLSDNITVAESSNPGENPIVALLAPGCVGKTETRIHAEADAILDRLGLDHRQTSSADMISLGQSKRVAIARAIAAGASILFLDEPLAGLDRQGVTDILKLLEALVREHRLTLVIVEHVFNQFHLQSLITTNWLLAGGRLETNHVTMVPVSPSCDSTHPAWLSLLAGPDAQIVDEILPHGALLTRIHRPGFNAGTAKPALEIRDLIVKRGHRTVLGLDDKGAPAGFNLTLHAGEIGVLQAPNGWGKSTLFASIAGLVNPEQGDIHLQGQSLNGRATWERFRAGLSALPSTQHIFPSLTGKESLRLAGAKEPLEELDGFVARPTSSYSGGQKQRLALAGMRSATVNLYDEPLAALDKPDPFLHHFASYPISNQAALVLIPGMAN